MRVTDLLALSHVPRWTIVPHNPPQSVGDHTFRVLVIAMELADRLKVIPTLGLVLTILHHDADESRTGDIPTPAKKLMATGNPAKHCPWWTVESISEEEESIFQLADLIEAFTFIEKNGIGFHSRNAAMGMQKKIKESCPPEWVKTVGNLVDDIVFESGR